MPLHDWTKVLFETSAATTAKKLTLVAYECDILTRTFIEPVAVRARLPDTPLFLRPCR